MTDTHQSAEGELHQKIMDILNVHEPVGQCSSGKCWGAESIENIIAVQSRIAACEAVISELNAVVLNWNNLNSYALDKRIKQLEAELKQLKGDTAQSPAGKEGR